MSDNNDTRDKKYILPNYYHIPSGRSRRLRRKTVIKEEGFQVFSTRLVIDIPKCVEIEAELEVKKLSGGLCELFHVYRTNIDLLMVFRRRLSQVMRLFN